MTEYGVVGVIITVLGLILSVFSLKKYFSEPLTQALKEQTEATKELSVEQRETRESTIKLTARLDAFEDGLNQFKGRYTEHLHELQDADRAINDRVDNHERRITILEAHENAEL